MRTSTFGWACNLTWRRGRKHRGDNGRLYVADVSFSRSTRNLEDFLLPSPVLFPRRSAGLALAPNTCVTFPVYYVFRLDGFLSGYHLYLLFRSRSCLEDFLDIYFLFHSRLATHEPSQGPSCLTEDILHRGLLRPWNIESGSFHPLLGLRYGIPGVLGARA